MAHAPDGSVVSVGRKTRRIHAALRRALAERDRHMCTFPGCGCTTVDGHHIKHWIDGGKTELANTALACRRHHVLLHELGYRIVLDGQQARWFTPYGVEIPRVPAMAETTPLTAVTDETTVAMPRWDGIGRVEYAEASELLAHPG